jgi:hypothetical protein
MSYSPRARQNFLFLVDIPYEVVIFARPIHPPVPRCLLYSLLLSPCYI